jgi:hypothetical protein
MKAPTTGILAIAVALLTLGAATAHAQSLVELDCDKCVDRDDIAQRAITTAKLKNGAVREQKLGRDVRDRFDTIESRFDTVSVAGVAFQPATPEVMIERTPAGVVVPLGSGDVRLTAGVALPHGMVLKELACTVRDASDPGIVQVSLRRFPLDAVGRDTAGDDVIGVASSEFVPLAESTGTDDYRIIYSIAGSPGVAIVDNHNFQYHLLARMIDIGDDPSAMALAGCSIGLGEYLF